MPDNEIFGRCPPVEERGAVAATEMTYFTGGFLNVCGFCLGLVEASWQNAAPYSNRAHKAADFIGFLREKDRIRVFTVSNTFPKRPMNEVGLTRRQDIREGKNGSCLAFSRRWAALEGEGERPLLPRRGE
jgi:hypothetical protein